ncbi:hypothetical protein QBC38DRAFT_182514 [Podospora fimiseda]|uniref:Uncharacterized protein n=1 Tax=Podospora fimiseda TaxID=252190 RepID=A0AAN7BQU6_9PEZI|nr:hypothetical protein QBC38DRAFT_182514 [Podospora fimiseda]
MPPPINQAVVASVGLAAATVVVAAAVAIYQDPEVRRVTDDLRRRIAIALRSLGDNVDPNRAPRFNRPEDAHGFYESHSVDADEETRRRQREELLYWNALRESQQDIRQPTSPHGSTFDDFLQPDSTGETGTLVYNTGAETRDDSNMLRRRGGNTDGVRGLNASMIANPFADEYGIELDEQRRIEEPNLLAPGQEEIMSDIYEATPVLKSASLAQQPAPITPLSNAAAAPDVLFDFDSQSQTLDSQTEYDTAADVEQSHGARTPTTARSITLERELAEDEYMTASNDDEEEYERAGAYASIQAWAQNSTSGGFYSPLPVTPEAALSEAELISEGHLTPTDSASVVDVGYDAASSRGGDYDVMSDSDDGIATPGSWSEIGSVISESESALRA